jgi:hypothetical protein
MLDNYRDLIDELLGTPTELRGLVDSRGEPPSAEDLALLVELLRRDQTVLGYLQEMTRTNDAYLGAAKAPEPAAEQDVPELLAAFDTARGELVSLLMNLTLRDWERTAIHETEGQLSLVDLVENHVDFDEDHVARLREQLG